VGKIVAAAAWQCKFSPCSIAESISPAQRRRIDDQKA
jgi:hypothetical protein